MQVLTKQVKAITVKQNAADWPKEYSCNFLESGLVSYEDSGAGIAMLRKETIMKMLPTFIGKPVVINHVDVTPGDFKDHAVGYITKVWWDDLSGWAWCSFILTEDNAKEKVSKGYSVSCAYDVHETGPGGEWHAIKYDEEILSGSGTHLALVLSPRYEDCRILVNSKKATINAYFAYKKGDKVRFRMKGARETRHGEIISVEERNSMHVYTVRADNGTAYELKISQGVPQNFETLVKENQKKEELKMIQLFKRANDKAGAEVDPNDPTKQKWNADQAFVKIENEYVPLSELAKYAKVNNDFEPLESVENEIEIDGVVHNVADLVENYKSSKANKANEEKKEEEEEKTNEEEKKEEEEEKENEEEEEEEQKSEKKQEMEEETIKKNAKKDVKHFVKLNTIKENGFDQSIVLIDTMSSRINRGIAKYGSSK